MAKPSVVGLLVELHWSWESNLARHLFAWYVLPDHISRSLFTHLLSYHQNP